MREFFCHQRFREKHNSLYFTDDVTKRVDYVLAYTCDPLKDGMKRVMRESFEDSLVADGLEAEHEDKEVNLRRNIRQASMFSPFSPFLAISLCRVGQYFSHLVFSILYHVFSQLVCLHSFLCAVSPSLFRSASTPSPSNFKS